MNSIKDFIDDFLANNEVEFTSNKLFSRHGVWEVNGREMTTRGMRMVLVPLVKEQLGISPQIMGKVLFKILVSLIMSNRYHVIE